MEDMRQRATDFVKALPTAQKVGVVTALVALVMMMVVFSQWVLSPSYTVLYSGLTDKAVAEAVQQLETQGVAYKLEAGGSTILVPQAQLYATRAAMASAGISGEAVPQGYELLSEQGLSVSDFRQRVDYQRALEGEVAKTLMAMDGVEKATVRLVMPEEELFAEKTKPVTASVLLTSLRDLNPGEVETVAFLVSSSVEGLELEGITIADADGSVLHAPGDAGGSSVASNRMMRQTREFEQALAADVRGLLERTSGSPASVVVRANLNYDERETETETYAPDGGVATKEQTTNEVFQGAGSLPGGTVGVDGGPQAAAGSDSNYEREDALREFGVDRTRTRTVAAPGAVEKLSVAIVMDDGAATGGVKPDLAEVEQLVSAALGLEVERGDEVAVSAMPFAEAAKPDEESSGGIMDLLPTIVSALVLVLVTLALLLMTRRRKGAKGKDVVVANTPAVVIDVAEEPPAEIPAPVRRLEAASALAHSDLRREVTDLVQRQPEEIATLLRSWLADRRA